LDFHCFGLVVGVGGTVRKGGFDWAFDVQPDARDYAHECAFFVLELKDEAVSLLDPPEGFTAGEW
jgi:hypothetical protein